VIVSSSAQVVGGLRGTVRLKVFTPLSGGAYRVAGTSDPVPAGTPGLAPVSATGLRIPVSLGDRIGVATNASAQAGFVSAPMESSLRFAGGDPDVGTTTTPAGRPPSTG
jgi:hypothetical protein